MMVSSSHPGDIISASKRQKTEEGHENNGCNTKQVPRSFAGVFYSGDEEDDLGPLVFKRSSLPSKSKADIVAPATKKDVSLMSDVNKVSKPAKPDSVLPVAVQKIVTTSNTSVSSATDCNSNPLLAMASDSHFTQPELMSTLPPTPLSGRKISIGSTVSANTVDCRTPNDFVSLNSSGSKAIQIPGSLSDLNSKASVLASKFVSNDLPHTSSNKPKDAVHGNVSGASLGTLNSQTINCRILEQGKNSPHSSKASNLARTKDCEIVTSEASLIKSNSRYDGDSIKNKPFATKLAYSTKEMSTLRQSANRLESSYKHTSQREEAYCSEEDKPLSERLVSSRNVPLKNSSYNSGQSSKLSSSREVSDDSGDDRPLAQRFQPNAPKKDLGLGRAETSEQLGHRKPLIPERVAHVSMKSQESDKFKKLSSKKRSLDQSTSSACNYNAKKLKASEERGLFQVKHKPEIFSDDEDEVPLAKRIPSSNSKLKPVTTKEVPSFSDDEDEVPLAKRIPSSDSKIKLVTTKEVPSFCDDEDEVPLAKRIPSSDSKIKPVTRKEVPSFSFSDDEDEVPLAKRIPSSDSKIKPVTTKEVPSFSDNEDEVPLAKRIPSFDSKIKPVTTKKVSSGVAMAMATKKVLEAKRTKLGKRKRSLSTKSGVSMPKGEPVSGGAQKWTTLEHNGVIFPPPYQPHGIKILYNGKPVDLTPAQEEVATMFAVMKDTDYATKPKFISNFWSDWKQILGSNHVIKKLDLCDFTPIYEWHLAEKEKKKSKSAEEKKSIKEEKLKLEEKYMWALVDGVKEKVGNFRVEPPGLFRGRGEHPKMGKLKRRIFPENIVINVGKDAPIPECPLPGHRWKEVRHDNTVTWLAYWNDPINTKEFKYVFLAPSSSLKGQSDKEKYEKSRKLKDYIEDIRKTYTKGFSSSDSTKRQIAVATYLIDRLALRAGNEKDDDEADTVGCCSLKVEHVSLVPPHSLEFDFLGKDSIRYFNTVEVDERVYKAIGDFKKSKKEGNDLFDKLDTSKLNTHLKEIMPGLTAKVFRTYNASITLDTQLQGTNGNALTEKIAAYQGANKEVAILCNHQRSVSKSHSAQMERLELKMAELQALRIELKRDLDRAKKGKSPLKDADGNAKRNQTPEALHKKLNQTNEKIKKMELDMRVKDDLKTVALGTSKINYMDPRITVAWCKLHEVPIEKIFNKSLLAKFSWAMDVEPNFRF